MAWFGGRDGYVVDGFTVVTASDHAVTLEAEGVGRRTPSPWQGTGSTWTRRAVTSLTVVPRFTDPADAVASGSLLAPMPGTVVSVAVGSAPKSPRGNPCWCLRR